MARIGTKSRFAFLEKAAKEAGLQAAPNSPVGRYLAYKKTETELKRIKTLTAEQIKQQRTQQLLALSPFGLAVGGAFTAVDFRKTTVSQWSALWVNSFPPLTDANLGWRGVSASTPDGADYYPSLLKVSVITNLTGVPKTSQITGRKYNYKESNSYSVPFGRTATITEPELVRRNTLMTAVKGATNFKGSVSYVPEYFDIIKASSSEVDGLTDAPVAT